MERVHLYISGHVQGVYFRDSTRKEAVELGVDGWVRNLPDGRVEAVFEGQEDAVESLVDWAKQGPPRAKVQAVDIVQEPPEGTLSGFEVRPTPRQT